MKAEVALRKGDATMAQTAYTAALSAALSKFSVSSADSATYFAANGTLVDLKQLMYEKWVASITQPEV